MRKGPPAPRDAVRAAPNRSAVRARSHPGACSPRPGGGRAEGVAVGGEGLHRLDGAREQLVELPAEHLGARADDVAVHAGREALVLELLLEGLHVEVHHALGRAHHDGRADEPRELLAGEQDLLHLELGVGQVLVEVARVRLDGADELGGAARRLDVGGRVDRVVHRVVGVLLPVEVVKQPHDAPELLVIRVEFAGEVAHDLLDRLAVLDVERVLVVLEQKRAGRLARHARRKPVSHRSSHPPPRGAASTKKGARDPALWRVRAVPAVRAGHLGSPIR